MQDDAQDGGTSNMVDTLTEKAKTDENIRAYLAEWKEHKLPATGWVMFAEGKLVAAKPTQLETLVEGRDAFEKTQGKVFLNVVDPTRVPVFYMRPT